MTEMEGNLSGAGKSFALVVARFNELVTERLTQGAADCLRRHGVEEEGIRLIRVPGAWELPQVVSRVASSGRYQGVVALGCIIRGGTPHFDFVAGEAVGGLGQVARSASVPVTLGVLTTDSVEQALERAGTKAGNKGWEAALSALEMASLFEKLE